MLTIDVFRPSAIDVHPYPQLLLAALRQPTMRLTRGRSKRHTLRDSNPPILGSTDERFHVKKKLQTQNRLHKTDLYKRHKLLWRLK